ncbi:PAS domain S-box protein [bacterium]|nr:PAS domain S-box protein [bacterium]
MPDEIPIKILTIDDEHAVRRSIRAYLEDSGYEVIEAQNGREGLDMYRAEQPDLILCDLRMPEVDGLEILSEVSEESPDTPIIIVSGTGVIGDAVEAVRLGAWDYILKPINDMGAFEHTIDKALERSRFIKQNRDYQEHLEKEVAKRTAELQVQTLELHQMNAQLQLEIAERRKAEEAIKDSEKRYREIVDVIEEGISRADEWEIIQYCNPAFARIYEVPIEELIGKSFLDFVDSDSRQIMQNQIAIRRTGETSVYELAIRTGRGNVRHIIVHASPRFDSSGEFIGSFGFVQDITERKIAQEELQRAEERYKAIFENAMVGIYQSAPEGYHLNVNPALARIYGYDSPEELITGITDIANQLYVDPTRRNEMFKPDELLNFESQIYRKDGRIIWIRENARAIRDADGNILYFVGIVEDITEKKMAEQRLRESQARFQDIAISTSDWLWEVDAQGVYTFCSEKVEKVLGYTSQEIIGKTPFDFMPPEEAQKISHQFRKIATKKAPIIDLENLNRHKDGHEVYLLTNGIPILDAEENLIGYRGADKDITERKRTEQSQLALYNIASAVNSTVDLQELFELIRRELGTVIDTTNFYIALYDKENDIISLAYFTDDKDTFTTFPAGKTLTAYVIKKCEPLLVTDDMVEEMSQTGDVEVIGTSSKVWLGVPLKVGGDAIGAVVVQNYANASAYNEEDLEILKFASDQIAIAIHRKRSEQALRESEAQYRSLIENSNDAIYLLTEGKFEIINRKFAELFGVTPEEVRAPEFNFMQMVAPKSQALIKERSRMADRGETPPPRYEFTALRKDGKEIDLEASISRILYQGKRATQGIIRDITMRKKMEAQLRQAQKMEAIGTLAGGIAHDFNNILTAILGYAEMAKNDVTEGGIASGSLDEVLNAGYRAKELVKQILAFSRQTEQERKPIDICPIVKEALKLLRASLPSTIQISQDIDSRSGTILADPTQIHQVIMNLCTNSYHAMREKGGILEVKMNSVDIDVDFVKSYPNLHEGTYLQLTVADSGCGMDSATLERIFEPFYTTKNVGEGTGMGLATVHGIITSYGGAITVYSEIDKGSTFHIYLPRLEKRVSVNRPEMSEILFGNERILFVDDEKQIVDMGKKMLEHLGYHVTIRTSSLEALEAFRAKPDTFDLVITDQTMPNMTGIEFAKEVMSIRPDIPIILATGFSETATEEQIQKVGIREYIMKPFVSRELGNVIRRALEGNKEIMS